MGTSLVDSENAFCLSRFFLNLITFKDCRKRFAESNKQRDERMYARLLLITKISAEEKINIATKNENAETINSHGWRNRFSNA